MLPAQLAAMALNFSNGLADGGTPAYVGQTSDCLATTAGGFASVSDLMTAANAQLLDNAYTPAGDANRQ